MSVVAFRAAPATTVCTVCASPGPLTVRCEQGGHELLECADCGVWSVHPQPPEDKLRSVYCEDYYRPWRREARARRCMWRRRMRLLRATGPGRLLDVGCAEGDFLVEARRAGFAVEGTEVSSHAAGRTALGLGVPVHLGDLEEAAFPACSFTVVTFWHVLEHLPRPREALQEAKRILEPRGLLVVAVPNRRDEIFRAAYRLARGKPPHLYHPNDREQHLHHWDPAALHAALDSCGFDVESIRPDPCALGMVKRSLDLVGRAHSAIAGEPRTRAMLALAHPKGDGQ